MKRINLAIFSGSDIRDLGGGEKYSISLSNYLIDWFNYNITIFSRTSNRDRRIDLKDVEKLTKANIEFYRSLFIPVVTAWFPISAKLVKLRRFDVIYNMDPSAFTAISLMFFAKLFRKRLIFGVHNPDSFKTIPAEDTLLKRVLIKPYSLFRFFLILRYPEVHVLNSDDKQKFEELGYGGKIHLIPNFLYTDKAQTINKKKNAKFRILFVGRLDIRQKGLDFLNEIVKNLLEVNNKIEVRVAGSGGAGELLIKDLTRRFPKNVKWFGFIQGNRLEREYKNADLFILTSRNEGFPLVMLEAQASGLPVVTFKIKGSKDIITKDFQGRLVDPFDTEDFANQILYYYNLWQKDPKKYASMRNEIMKEIGNRYSPKIIIPKIERMLRVN